MGYLLKNGNTTRKLLFLIVQSSDHITGLTGATPTVTISKNGATFATPSGAVSEVGSGWYAVAANATDANTNGPLLLHATAASGDPTDDRFEVVNFDPDDAVRLGLTALPNVASGSVGAIPTTGTGANQINVDGAGNASANVAKWNSHAVLTENTSGVPIVDGRSVSLRVNTAQAGAAGTITLDSGASATTNFYNGLSVSILSGTGAGQAARIITAYNGTSKVATVSPNWATNPDATSVFALVPASCDVETWLLAAVTAATAGVPDVNTKNINAVSTSSVTTVAANLGTTQPVNFTGTGAGALVKSDTIDWNSVGVGGMPNSTTPPTTSAIATAVWQDATSGDFTVASSIGKSLYTSGNAPGAASGLAIVGSNMGTVTSVTGSVGSVTAVVSANVTQWGGTSVGTLPPDSVFIRTGTAQGGGASTITLDSGASATNNLYENCVIQIRGGTGAGQSAIIASYVGSTKVATINGSWATNPDATSTFTILPFGSISASVSGNVTVGGYAGGEDPATLVWGALRSSFTTSGTFGQGVASVQGNVTGSVASVTAAVTVGTNNDKTGYRLLTEIRNGTAQAGAASSITLDSGASATDSLYKGCWIVLTSGTGVGQARLCTAYVGATKVATVSPNWATNPDATSAFTVLPAGDVLDVANSVNQTGDSYAIVNSGTFGNSALHTQIGLPQQVGTKYNVLLNASDVTGNVTADLQTIKTQAVTCAAGVTIGAFVGNATHAIVVDTSGFVTFNNTSIATATSVTNPVTLTGPDSPIDFTCTLGSQTGATSSQIILNGGPATDGILVGQRVRVYSGTGNHQERVITSYNHTTGVTGIDWPWTTQPASGDTAAVLYADSPALNSSLDITLPAIPSGWITAAGIAASALNGKGDWLLASNYRTSVTVAAYAANEDPWSIIKAASPSATPSAGTVELLLRLLDADWSIDTTTTPWDLVATIKGTGLPSSMGGTGTEILRKRIRDTGSANIGNTSTAVGQMIQ